MTGTGPVRGEATKCMVPLLYQCVHALSCFTSDGAVAGALTVCGPALPKNDVAGAPRAVCGARLPFLGRHASVTLRRRRRGRHRITGCGTWWYVPPRTTSSNAVAPTAASAQRDGRVTAQKRQTRAANGARRPGDVVFGKSGTTDCQSSCHSSVRGEATKCMDTLI